MPRQTKARRKSGAGKRYPLNMRTTKAIRDKLEKAAAASGRSLAQEVELRLEQSFFSQELMIGGLELAYGRQLAGVLLLLGEAIQLSCKNSIALMILTRPGASDFTKDFPFPTNWIDTPVVFDEALLCVITILRALRPSPQVELIMDLEGPGVNDVGKFAASKLANEVLRDVAIDSEMQERAQTIHSLLGPVADRLERLREEPEDQI